MTARREASGRSPLALRLIHAAVFLAFAAGVVAAAFPEWQHVLFALGRPYHVGSPPRALLVLGSVLAAAGAAALLVALLRGRSAPLAVSWLILGGAGAALLGASGGSPPERPSEISSNTALIVVGQRVQLTMVEQLQQRGEVPVTPGPWQEALEHITQAQRLFRSRTFQPVPPQVVAVETPEAVPQPLQPGSLLLFVSPDGAAFEMRLVGLSEGLPQVLRDETGGAVVLRGLYNPNLPSSPAPTSP